MGAKQLLPLRRRGTEEQRDRRVCKALRRGSRPPRVGINYPGLWARQRERALRGLQRHGSRLAHYVNIQITQVIPSRVHESDFTSYVLAGDKYPYTSDPIWVVKRAFDEVVAERIAAGTMP